MVKDLVDAVHADLKDIRNEAAYSAGTHPLFIRMLDNLIKLTDTNSADAVVPDGAAASGVTVLHPASDVTECPHNNLNVYGKCLTCGQCTHPKTDGMGFCLTCDQKVTDF